MTTCLDCWGIARRRIVYSSILCYVWRGPAIYYPNFFWMLWYKLHSKVATFSFQRHIPVRLTFVRSYRLSPNFQYYTTGYSAHSRPFFSQNSLIWIDCLFWFIMLRSTFSLCDVRFAFSFPLDIIILFVFFLGAFRWIVMWWRWPCKCRLLMLISLIISLRLIFSRHLCKLTLLNQAVKLSSLSANFWTFPPLNKCLFLL